jgi:hypothetical protein
MGTTTDTQINAIASTEELLSLVRRRKMEDISAWDYSVQPIDFEMSQKVRVLCNNGLGTVWDKISKALYYCAQRKVFAISDGKLLAQKYRGVMGSGWHLTASMNSKTRVMTADVAASLESKKFVHVRANAMGDDAIFDDVFKDTRSAFQRIHRKVKEAGTVIESLEKGFEWCSTVFKRDGGKVIAYPVNVEKQMWNLLCNQSVNTTPNHEYTEFIHRFRDHPNLSHIKKVLEDCGFIASLTVNKGDDDL